MSTDFELFKGKSLSSLFKDIYTNQVTKKDRISELIEDVRTMTKHAGDMAVLGPIIKDLIETSVKNDEQLVKLATIAQRIIASDKKTEGDDGYLSAAEKAQLLKDLEDARIEVQKVEDLEDEVDKLKKKIT